jgi:hypothetical protein
MPKAPAVKTATRNPGDDLEEDFELGSEFDGQELVTVSTSFPPYLVIEEGRKFACTVQSFDYTDPDFPRFVCKNIGKNPLLCMTGKRQDGAEVEVEMGGEFTVSWFSTLPLEWAMRHGTPLIITPLEKEEGRKMANGKPGSLWRFSYETTKAGKLQIEGEKNRALGYGKRMITQDNVGIPNPAYLVAFMGDAPSLAAPAKPKLQANAEA